MMLVGVIPSAGSSDTHHPRPSVLKAKKHDDDLAATALALALTESTMKRDDMELTRRQADKDASSTDVKVIGCDKMSPAPTLTMADLTAPSKQDNYSTCMGSLTVMQSLILLNILLDFGGCIFANIGLSMAGSGVFQVIYSSERPEPKDLCLKMGICCVSIISVYQMFWVLPQWTHIITEPVMQANGDPIRILGALFLYTVSQLAHGLTYFMMLGACGAVLLFSSISWNMALLDQAHDPVVMDVMLCWSSHQESQCFDAKRGIATLFVVAGVLFYSWAKGEAKIQKPVDSTLKKMPLPHKNCIV
ncbi:hypothetical protein DYB32_005027 [Aphanomyces invadans]|uniref:Uncharacterized protein n=1 Tax=Aphanomyces invadans TaxID=157072 RepID=A0A418AVT0_9STRA|nr:hypothetical protein DYB32_005027 [Aphanomyces invadans]